MPQIENVDNIRQRQENKNTNQKSEKDDVEKGPDNGTTHKKSEEQKVFGGYQFKEVSYRLHYG